MSVTRTVEGEASYLPLDDTGNILSKAWLGVGLGIVSMVGFMNEKVAPVSGFDELPAHLQNSAAHIGIGYLGAWTAYATYEPIKDCLAKLGTHKTHDYFTRYLDSHDPVEAVATEVDIRSTQKVRHLVSIGVGMGVNLLTEVLQANSRLASARTADLFGEYMIKENSRDAAAALLGCLAMSFMARKDHLKPKLDLS